MRHFGALLVVVAAPLVGCVVDADDSAAEGPVASAEQEIQNGDPATSFYWHRAALFNNCTGTVIGRRHVLTASHCEEAPGKKVWFYDSSTNIAWERAVVSVTLRPGVDPTTDDFSDTSGKFADIAVVELDSDLPAAVTTANMAWAYPSGGDDWGMKVGAGAHDGNGDLFGELRMIGDWTYSDNDGDGHFLTENEQTNPGDSGGTFYYGGRILGALYGKVFEWEYRNKYTSVPHHLSWILSTMGYAWPGEPETVGLARTGAINSTLVGTTKRVCQYACDRTSACVAYSYRTYPGPSQCTLLSSVTGLSSNAFTSSAEK